MPRQESRIRRFRIANLHLKIEKIFLVSVSLNGLKWMFILILTARFNKQTFLIIEHKVFFFPSLFSFLYIISLTFFNFVRIVIIIIISFDQRRTDYIRSKSIRTVFVWRGFQ